MAPMATNPSTPTTPDTLGLPSSDAAPGSPDPGSPEEKGYQNRGAVGFEDANDALAHALQSEIAGKLQLDTTQLVIVVTDQEIALSGTVPNAEQKSGVASLAAVIGAPRKVVDNLKVVGLRHSR